jgi:hypothetical protein
MSQEFDSKNVFKMDDLYPTLKQIHLDKLNKGDTRFAFVKFVNYVKSYSHVEMGTLYKIDDKSQEKEYKVGSEYRIMWKDKHKYGILILHIGTLDECREKEKLYFTNEQNTENKSTIKKGATAKQTKIAINESNNKFEIDLLNKELQTCRKQLDDLSLKNEHLQNENCELKKEIETIKVSRENEQSDFNSLIDKDRLLDIAKTIFKNLAAPADLEEIQINEKLNNKEISMMVLLSIHHNYRVQKQIKNELELMISSQKTVSSIIRTFFNSIFADMDDKLRGAYNATSFREKHEEALNAFDGNV